MIPTSISDRENVLTIDLISIHSSSGTVNMSNKSDSGFIVIIKLGGKQKYCKDLI